LGGFTDEKEKNVENENLSEIQDKQPDLSDESFLSSRMKFKKFKFIFLASIIIVIISVSKLSNNIGEHEYYDYVNACERIVESRLKATSIAEYSNIKLYGSDDVIAKGYVDAENGFGAMVRMYFTITFNNDNLNDYDVNIN